ADRKSGAHAPDARRADEARLVGRRRRRNQELTLEDSENMAKVDVFNLKRQKVGDIDLSDEVFGAEVKEQLLHEVVVAQLASRRAGTHAAKERSAVSGSSKKIYKQKGTGRARHGSIRAPSFVGGGQQHGPKPHSFSYRPPAAMRRGALVSCLSLKLKEGHLTIVDTFVLDEVKTKKLASV